MIERLMDTARSLGYVIEVRTDNSFYATRETTRALVGASGAAGKVVLFVIGSPEGVVVLTEDEAAEALA